MLHSFAQLTVLQSAVRQRCHLLYLISHLQPLTTIDIGLQILLELGLVNDQELQEAIATEFNPSRVSFNDRFEMWVEDVLNLGVVPRYACMRLTLQASMQGWLVAPALYMACMPALDPQSFQESCRFELCISHPGICTTVPSHYVVLAAESDVRSDDRPWHLADKDVPVLGAGL